MDVEYTKVKSIECLGEVDDYVYDLSIKHGDTMFFGNDCLLKNTDSMYFSSYPVMSKLPDFAEFGWRKEQVSQLYDQIADITNNSFPEFMKKSFNVPETRGGVIRAGRELCATRGLFITKKRYAVLIYDKEGKRKDVDGKPGEIKAMGLDLKRSDTPKPVQEFLIQVLTEVLNDSDKNKIFDIIKQFRATFNSWPGWAKGTPKRVNNLTMYGNVKRSQESVDLKNIVKKKSIPGHVAAALAWNKLRELHGDRNSMQIQDGQKIIVVKLRDNPLGFTSVAYPVDQLMLPEWFKTLPFDHETMELTLIDKKLDNLLGVLNWDLVESRNSETFDSMFSFG
jgi:DNA polymerase elongation subunit (family B)